MIRALFFILIVSALALLFSWFAENPGQLVIDWPGYQIEITLFRFTVAVAILAALIYLLITALSRLFGSPKRLRRFLNRRREDKGYNALRRGIFAVGAGDEAAAASHALEARRALRNEPLTMLLDAQSAQLTGDHRAAQRLFEAMSETPDMRLLGLRGLFLEASREKQMVAAEQYAARAMQINPALQWPVNALFDMQCRAMNWRGALETLSIARTHRHVTRQTYDRRKAVLLTALARDLEERDAAQALEHAMEAHRIAPGLVPAAVIAGRILASQGNTARAARVLAKTWQYSPHPDLALGYAYARPGDSPQDRLNRIKSLIVLNHDETEARLALASAAIDARDWEEARDALEPLIGDQATARVCALMARIEGGENSDAGRVREWLARAVRAPRDPVWMADGVIFSEWQPVSPISGTLDAFEWRVPPDRSERGENDLLADEFAELSHDMENVALPIADHQTVQGETEAVTIHVETVMAEAEKQVEQSVSEPEPEPKPESRPSVSAFIASARKQTANTETTPEVTAVSGTQSAAQPDVEESQPEVELKSADVVEPENAEIVPAGPEQPAQETGTSEPDPEPELTGAPDPKPKPREPNIFIPNRAPDDPGPDQVDYDENSTPYTRFHAGSKTQPN